MDVKYVFKINGLPKDTEYNRMSFGRQIEYRQAIEQFKGSAKSIHFSAKNKSTRSGFLEFKKLYRPTQWFLIDHDAHLYHDDSFQVWYTQSESSNARKDGTIGPLFINRKQVIPIGKWLQAEENPTKGFAFRPGWHCVLKPEAPHLKVGPDRRWHRVLVAGEVKPFYRPESQGGTWILAEKIKALEECDDL